jgi:predicted PurR-regulated permease PerM
VQQVRGWLRRGRDLLSSETTDSADGVDAAAQTRSVIVQRHVRSATAAPLQVELEPQRLRRSVLLILMMLTGWLVAVWIFSAISQFLFLLLLAWLLAIAMEPAISWLVRRGVRRGVATALTGGGATAGGLVVVALFGTAFVNQLIVLVQTLPDIITGAVDWVNRTFDTSLDPDTVAASLQITPEEVTGWASSLAGGVFGWFGSLVSVFFDLFTVAVFTFYFAGSGPRLLEALAVWMPPERQRVVGTVWEIVASKIGGYLVSKLALASLSAVFHGVFFWAIGLPSWLPMALLAGITAQFVPVVGTYIGVAIPMLLALFTDAIDVLWILVFSTIYQQLETYVFTPRVSRRTMDVHPAIALGAVFVGAAIWGPIGALIGIPLAAAVVAVAETYARQYRVVDELATTEAAPPEGAPPSIPEKAPDDSIVSDVRPDGAVDVSTSQTPVPSDAPGVKAAGQARPAEPAPVIVAGSTEQGS